ncbi:hypothetical protein [Peptoniphilus senegalensis]|mgnify:CR=1 FL=1|uniref:Uncharacterized protein n=1 Tax=Peptoniphilus senegalensis TaxID=1465757 RepID=A0ABV1J3K5_9FIRM|nr:hypothetical protein [Peptoniphilus senegalensis]
MNKLRSFAYLLIALGFGLQIPKKLENYKKEKNLENLLMLLSSLIIVPAAIILVIAYFIGE